MHILNRNTTLRIEYTIELKIGMINLSSSKNLVNAASVAAHLAIHAVLLVVINVVILAVTIIAVVDTAAMAVAMVDTVDTAKLWLWRIWQRLWRRLWRIWWLWRLVVVDNSYLPIWWLLLVIVIRIEVLKNFFNTSFLNLIIFFP